NGLSCDNWATNTTEPSLVNQTYVREREDFLRFLDKEHIENVVFITSDALFAVNIRVEEDFDGDGDNLFSMN
ncbi:MAG: hypothetical protein ACRD47_13455, partial [Nitrososphaeraceae archaeon]